MTISYVYRWEGNKHPPDGKLFAVFMHERDADRFVLMANWILFAMTAVDSANTQALAASAYWSSPYGPTLPGNEDITPPNTLNPVLPNDY